MKLKQGSTIVAFGAVLLITGCGTKTEKSSERVFAADAHTETHGPVKNRGSFALAMPEKDDAHPYLRMDVALHGICEAWDDEVTYDVEGDASGSGEADSSDAKKPENYGPRSGGSSCGSEYSASFDADKSNVASIDEVTAGTYSVEVSLYDENGDLFEQGSETIEIVAGKETGADVYLSRVEDQNGKVTLVIHRADENDYTRPMQPIASSEEEASAPVAAPVAASSAKAK